MEKPAARQSQSNICKDEMNLAEFPLSVIGKRPPKDVKTLSFEDEITDPSTGKRIQRQWTVTSSDLLGLPTSVDEEVLVGCLKLTKNNGMKFRKVPFTAYEFLEELHWARDGKNYRRLTESLDRWTGTTVLSNDAFWHKGKKKRIKDTFSLIDRWKLQDDQAAYQGKNGWFIWGDFMWESLQAGNIRSLDFDFWIQLKSPISKRLFRLLDKRFYQRKEVPFPLKQLAFDKVGVSRKMHTGQLKATLSKAHSELEQKGFCKSDYVKRGRGDWEVVYTDIRKEKLASSSSKSEPLCEKLLQRGVDKPSHLVQTVSKERIAQSIENYDDRKKQGEALGPGWLRECITRKKTFDFRQGYISKAATAAKEKTIAQKQKAQKLAQQQAKENKRVKLAQSRQAFLQFFQSLPSDEEREAYARRAIESNRFFRDFFHESQNQGNAAKAERHKQDAMLLLWERENATAA